MRIRPPRTDQGEASRQSFEEFYITELDGQIRRAALILDSAELAADVVHDAMIAVYNRWGKIAEPAPYLSKSVLNRCRDHFRRRSRLAALAATGQTRLSTDSPDELFDVVRQLPFNQRAAVVLRFYADFTEAEIADALAVPSGSIGPWLHRALIRIRKELT